RSTSRRITCDRGRITVAPQKAQVGRYFASGVVAPVAVLFHALAHDAFELSRNVVVESGDGNWFPVKYAVDNLRCAGALKGQFAGEHFVDNVTEREDVGTLIDV